ncbi:MAG: aminotransferase class V-fold PLP-dependent enzyme [Saprospiraceae bacterium]|nr:aminotransferase class V-fold PLP-dependent enzyme [Saprospiraceae bacterium]
MTKTSLLQTAYDPEAFRSMGYQLIDELADYLATCQAGGEGMPANPWIKPDAAKQRWSPALDKVGSVSSLQILSDTLKEGVHLHHPKYMGHQISPPIPITALAGLVSDWMNNGMGVYEMGVPGSTMEHLVIKKVSKHMGFSEAADGFITSGGTLANTTALLAARSIKARQRVWTEGHKEPLALMVSEAAHYCVDRAVKIMGWGETGIIKVPVNDRYQMDTGQLEHLYQSATEAGTQVIAVVGSACSTATGSFDDLEAIATFCQQYDLWFHVDGAHGAALAFSGKYKDRVKGIELADSVAMDFHKMLLTPSITTALIFKEGTHSYQTFSQRADYLFEQADPEWFNFAKRTFECTKLMLGLKAFMTLSQYGVELWDEAVTAVMDLSQAFGEMIRNHPAFELAVEPACNIVCFRYKGNDLSVAEQNQLNEQIRQALLEDGEFYIVKTWLGEGLWLRTTLANPLSTTKELQGLLGKIEGLVPADQTV